MKLLTKKNRWECLLYSMSMALDTSPEELVEVIGHDGSQILDSEAPEPQGRRGFHIQEFVPHILSLGKTMTPFELLPVNLYPNGRTYREPLNVERYQSFMDSLHRGRGVITGVTEGQGGHAVAFHHHAVYDPDGPPPYAFNILTCAHRGFHPQCMWIIK